ncbi:hypothetical protein Q1695_006860 [Nippostrongylus brasiliensis]|nr:hypothetical protein Q1695_006860 [Nippostrongylus brasiliensis]
MVFDRWAARSEWSAKSDIRHECFVTLRFFQRRLACLLRGTNKRQTADLFTGDSRFPQLKIGNAVIGTLEQILQRTRPHTYSNSLILSLEDLPICKGSELDEIAFVIFPLVAAVEALPDQIAAASLIGYWLCLRIMASYWQLSADRITVAQRATSVAKELWMALAPEIFKMRCHASSNAEE